MAKSYVHSVGALSAHSKHREELALNVPHLWCSWSSGTTEVTDASSGAVLFRIVRPKTMDLKHGRKGLLFFKFYDAAGSLLFTIRNTLIHPHTFVAYDPVFDHPMFTITQRCFSFQIQFDITVHSSLSGVEENVKLEANWIDHKAEMLHDGRVVVRIHNRRVDSTRLLSLARTYALTVAPGVDASLVVAACTCLNVAANRRKH